MPCKIQLNSVKTELRFDILHTDHCFLPSSKKKKQYPSCYYGHVIFDFLFLKKITQSEKKTKTKKRDSHKPLEKLMFSICFAVLIWQHESTGMRLKSWSLSSLFRLFRLASVPHVSASSAEARGDIIPINCPALRQLGIFCDGEMNASACTSSLGVGGGGGRGWRWRAFLHI